MTEETNQILKKIGVRVPKIILPKDSVDMTKWAVVACDQFTSEPGYWENVEKLVGDEPSTVKIVLPEVYLESENKTEKIEKINAEMKKYLETGVLEEKFEGMVAVERASASEAPTKRYGLVVALDLEKYEYTKGSKTLIRATEGTVESRIPPRLEIRKNAMLELPHIMVLIDDPSFAVSQYWKGDAQKGKDLIYDFDLMMDGGHVKGWKITDEEKIKIIAQGLGKLISGDGFLFAMGDGNHSLATAKAHWNNIKKGLSEAEKEDHPARFALVELVNVHDSGLEFEPIHRVLFGVDPNKLVEYVTGEGKEVEVVVDGQKKPLKIKEMGSNLPVGDLQQLLDSFMAENPEVKIDYVHGEGAVMKLAVGKNVGFLLSVMKKEELFPTVEKDGALPRKTFSMGEAEEKRYYVEARKIVV